MSHYLDINNVKELPDFLPENTPNLIPIQKGKWHKDWDVIEEQMPPGWKVRFKLLCKKLGVQQQANLINPVGFDSFTIPPGAKIITVSES